MPGRRFSEGWTPEFVEHVAETLDIGPGTEVFEVACGSGEFLIPLHENGFIVGGLEADPALVAAALAAMPDGRFMAGPPAELDPGQPWQVVICRSFADFPDADHARGVLARMAAKATHAVAILDVPEGRFERRWLVRALAEIGASAVQVEEVSETEVEPTEARYNVFARL